MTFVVLVGVAVLLFALSFVTKRRFGVLGLGLAAGVLLSHEVAIDVASFLQYMDIPVEPLSYQTTAVVLLTIIPALILLLAGPRYHSARMRLIGSVGFGLFGAVLLLPPLSQNLSLSSPATASLVSSVAANSPLIIAVCVIVAVLDMAHTHHTTPAPSGKSKH